MRNILLLLLLLLSLASACGPAWCGIPDFKISLSEAEEAAVSASPLLKAAILERAALEDRAAAQHSSLLPRFALEGYYRYTTEVPSLAIPIPGFGIKQLGDHRTYSIGPSVYWTLWDRNAARESWLSVRALSESKAEEVNNIRLQVTLAARLAYFNMQLSLAQARLVGDSLKLAQAQYRDIRAGESAGARSRVDALFAHQEVLTRKKLFNQARAELAAAARELFAITGLGGGFDPAMPLYGESTAAPPEDTEPATLFITPEPIEISLAALEPAGKYAFNDGHPGLAALSRLAESERSLSLSSESSLWPRLQLSARSSLDYPNGPDLNSIFQNTAGLSLSFPLFEGGRSSSMSAEQEKEAEAAEKRRDQTGTDLLRDYNKALDQLKWLRIQQEINRQYTAEAEELAGLTYKSYGAGRSTFIEVQTANLRLLEAKIETVRTDVKVLAQLALLSGMGK